MSEQFPGLSGGSTATLGVGDLFLVSSAAASGLALEMFAQYLFVPVASDPAGRNLITNIDWNTAIPAANHSIYIIGGTSALENRVAQNQNRTAADGGSNAQAKTDPNFASGNPNHVYIMAYDTLSNGLASTNIGCHHGMIGGLSTHGALIGGSSNEINDGDYGFNVGGGGAALGDPNVTTGDRAGNIGGSGNTASGDVSTNVGSTDCTASGTNAVTVGSESTSVGGVRSVAMACLDSVINAANALGVGRDHLANAGAFFSAIFGEQVLANIRDTLYIGAPQVSEQGDKQALIFPQGARTTDEASGSATYTNFTSGAYARMSSYGANFGVISGTVHVRGIDEATGDTCVFTSEVALEWLAGGAGTVKAGGPGDFVALYDDIGVFQEPAVVTNVAADFRVRVYGKAATNIKWSVSFFTGMTHA